MPAFEYEALTAKGKKTRGVVTGDSPRQIRETLRDQGLTPLEVNAVHGVSPGQSAADGNRVGGNQKIGTTDLAVVTRQFATLLDSGLTIEQSLGGLVEQSESHKVKSVLTGIRSTVMEGRSLADGLRRFPRSFSELYVASVAAGEETGHLEQVLDRLAD